MSCIFCKLLNTALKECLRLNKDRSKKFIGFACGPELYTSSELCEPLVSVESSRNIADVAAENDEDDNVMQMTTLAHH